MEEIDERLDRLERKLDLIGSAVAELGLKAYPELDPLNAMNQSRHVQAKLSKYAGNVVRVVALLGPKDNSYAADLERFIRERDAAAAAAQRIPDEEAEALNRRLVRTYEGSRQGL
jgi:hypothetical protein